MTEAEIKDKADLLRAAGRTKVPVPIEDWVAMMLAKIGDNKK